MLPKTTHPRTVLHHRVNQKTHKEQPHHGVKSQDALAHPIGRHSLRRTGTPSGTQRAGTQRHRKIINRHAKASTGYLRILSRRRHELSLVIDWERIGSAWASSAIGFRGAGVIPARSSFYVLSP